MFSGDEIKLVLMSSGVTLSLVALAFAIRNRVVDRKRSLKIEHSTQGVLIQDNPFTDAKFQHMDLTLSVLNNGAQPVFVHHLHVKLPVKRDGYDQFQLMDMNSSIQYPYKIESGDTLKFRHGLREFHDEFCNVLNPENKVSFFIEDTLGKRYQSKKVKFAELTKHIETETLLRNQNV